MLAIDLIVQATGFGAFLWLALFILSRADRQRPQTIITVVALLTTACLFLSLGLVNTTNGPLNPILARAFWWTDILPMTIWLHISHQIVRHEARPLFTLPMIINYVIAEAITVGGIFTDLFLDYSHAEVKAESSTNSVVNYYYGPGVAYPIYILYLFVAGGLALWNIWQAWQETRSQTPAEIPLDWKLRFLFMGGSLFLAGTLYQTLREQVSKVFPNVWEWPGHLILIAGLAILGYSVAHYDMMMVGKNIQRDFIYTLTGTFAINLVYVLLIGLVGGINPLSLFVIVGLATTSHTIYDFGRQQLDRLFFSQDEQQARAEAWAYATALASNPVSTPESVLELESTVDPEDEKGFKNAVRRSITSLKNPPQMIKSPLLSLRLVERRVQEAGLEDNRLNRAAILRELLLELIERLRPDGLSGETGTLGTGDAWRFYNVLYFPYVREISRKSALSEVRRLETERKRTGVRETGELEQVLNWLTDVDEDTFYKWQRKASDMIASILREDELRLQPAKRVGTTATATQVLPNI